jgi:demethylmenaquinone methyltransferase/2-methoxy-6-polyprenyl-1,4-benzoquinol methylase
LFGLDHFSLIAPIYDRVISNKELEKLITLARLPVSGRLLDAGGGTGRVTQALRNQSSQIVVADLSLGMLQQTVAKNGLQPVNTQTEALPFPDKSFDRVIMVDALHHVFNQNQTARELWRVLKTGGRLVIEEPDVRTFVVKLVALGEKLMLMRSHFLSPPRIAALFDDPTARIYIETESYTSWVVVEK